MVRERKDSQFGRVSACCALAIRAVAAISLFLPLVVLAADIPFQPGPFDFAAYATAKGCGAINLAGNASTDSFDSNRGTYLQTKQAIGGNVGSSGNIALDGSILINGFIAALNTSVGTCQGGTPGITLIGNAFATGGYLRLPAAPVFATPPTVIPGTQDYHFTTNASLAPGSYRNVVVSDSKTLTLSPGFYNLNSLVVSGNAVVTISPTGPVVINLAGNNAAPLQINGGGISNPSGIAANFQLIYAGTSSIDVAGGSDTYALLYAPNAPVSLNGNADWFGAMVVSTLADPGGASIHYDRHLIVPPTITAQVSPAANSAGWNNANVTVSFTCSDPIFAITSCTSPVLVTSEGANQIVTGMAVNQVGVTASTAVTLNLDKTPPTISGSATPAPNALGWNQGPVII